MKHHTHIRWWLLQQAAGWAVPGSALVKAEITGLNKAWAAAPTLPPHWAQVSVLCVLPTGTKGVPRPLKPERQLRVWRTPLPHPPTCPSWVLPVFEQPHQNKQQCPLELIKVKDTGATLKKSSIQGRQTHNNTNLAYNTAFLSNPQTTLVVRDKEKILPIRNNCQKYD